MDVLHRDVDVVQQLPVVLHRVAGREEHHHLRDAVYNLGSCLMLQGPKACHFKSSSELKYCPYPMPAQHDRLLIKLHLMAACHCRTAHPCSTHLLLEVLLEEGEEQQEALHGGDDAVALLQAFPRADRFAVVDAHVQRLPLE